MLVVVSYSFTIWLFLFFLFRCAIFLFPRGEIEAHDFALLRKVTVARFKLNIKASSS